MNPGVNWIAAYKLSMSTNRARRDNPQGFPLGGKRSAQPR